MANGSTLAGLAAAAVLATSSAQAEKTPDFSDVINAGGARVEVIQKNTRIATNQLVTETQPILLAQATQETDGKTYLAEVVQVDGSKRSVMYYRDPKGAIMAPPVKDGKLVDGNLAPENPVEARIAQKKILAKYDKGALTALASVGPNDLIAESFKDIETVRTLVEQGKPISRDIIQKSLIGQYILILSGSKIVEIMKTTELIASTQLKMNVSEIAKMKQEAESKAKSIWKSATGAMGIG